jgi:glycosyltransferase involved in cell wall biosynthesis
LFLYRKANRIVSVTESFKRNLIERGVDASKITVITNGVDLANFAPREKDAELVGRYGLHGKFVAGYIGTHGMAHALDTILEAAEQIREMPHGDRFRFILLGDGANKSALQQRAAGLNLDNILFIEPVSKNEIARYWSLLDVSIIHLKKTELFTTVIPSKLFECMAMGIPVLHGVQGESAEIVEQEDVGLLFEPESLGALVQGLVRLAEDGVLYQRIKNNGPLSAEKFDRKKLAAKMLDAIEASYQTAFDN